MLISIDGGIGPQTIQPAAAHGANLFVAGTSLFKADDMTEAVNDLRSKAQKSFNSEI
jgi:ribulose-phosphate 3-epimerase